jgi:hypothetical protein
VPAHEQMVIFDPNRPTRGKTILKAGADSATPAGLTRLIGNVVD